MSFLSFGNKSVLGVDIGTSSIKIVELTNKTGRYHLTNYGQYQFNNPQQISESSGSEEKDKVSKVSIDDLAAGIRDVIGAAGIKSKDAVASIPSFLTFSTTISMPFVSEDEVEKAIPYEARKYIPIPLSEVQLDWAVADVRKSVKNEVLQQDSKNQPGIDVFLVAVSKVDIARYQNIMKSAGLNMRALELESFALIRALVGNDLSPTAIINMGGRSTSILICENGFQRSSHDYEVGGFAITNMISKSLGINYERAMELQSKGGINGSDDNIIRQAISSLLDTMSFEINKAIHNYEDQKKTKITKIIVVGGLVNMPGIVNYISEKLGRPIVLGDPLSKIAYPKEIDQFKTELNSSFVVSLGLAMRPLK